MKDNLEKISLAAMPLLRVMVITLFLCLFLGTLPKEEVQAYDGAYSGNAENFYDQYGADNMKFFSISADNGRIYFCSRGKTSATTSGTKYRTVGWQFHLYNTRTGANGYIYYDCDGEFIKKSGDSIHSSDGYTYNLYYITLQGLKDRLDSSWQSAFTAGEVELKVNACMTTVVNGVVKGSIDDDGNTTGTVYKTYDGIANAANWSSNSKTTLQTYFDKTIDGLFHKITINKGTGISSTSGAGTYLYGTKVTVKATLSTGYQWDSSRGSKWTGTDGYSSTSQNSYYTVGKYDVTLTVNASGMQVKVTFHKNDGGTDETYQETYTYGGSNQYFGMNLSGGNEDWYWWNVAPEGYYLPGDRENGGGWSTDPSATKAGYSMSSPVGNSWITENEPSIDLYMIRPPKKITVTFHKNDGGTDETYQETYTYGVGNQYFGMYLAEWDANWYWWNVASEGYYLPEDYANGGGWSADPSAATGGYSMCSHVGGDWINANTPSIDLYMIRPPKKVTVTFHKNDGGTDETYQETYTYGVGNQYFGMYLAEWDANWCWWNVAPEGYYLPEDYANGGGWSGNPDAAKGGYSMCSPVGWDWINANTPHIDVYMIRPPKAVTVTFHKNDGGTDETYQETYTAGVSSQWFGMNRTGDSAYFNDWTREGYGGIANWAKNAAGTGVMYNVCSSVTDGWIDTYSPSLDLYAVWEPLSDDTGNSNTRMGYKIYHYFMDLDGENYSLWNTENKTGTTGEILNLSDVVLSPEGFCIPETMKVNGKDMTSTTVNGDGTTEIYLYYDRLKYQLEVSSGYGVSDVEINGTDTRNMEVYYGEEVTVNALVKNGYQWDGKSGWSGTLSSDQQELSFAMPAEDVALKADASIVYYDITYDLSEGTVTGNPDQYTIEDTFTLNNPVKVGYEFLGWTGSNGDTALTSVVIPEGTTGNLHFIANWKGMSGIQYKIHHYFMDLDGENYSLWKTENLAGTTGDIINFSDVVLSPEGFKIPSSMVEDGKDVTSTAVKGDGTTEIYLYYDRLKYQLEISSGYGVSGVKINGTDTRNMEVYYGEEVTVNALVKKGYQWDKESCWSGTLSSDLQEFSFTMPAEDVVLKADASIVYYDITYELNGGTVTGNPDQYTIEDTFTLNNPVKEGYEFSGWTGSIGGTPQISVVIPKGTTGELQLKANWNANSYTIIFDGNHASGSMEPMAIYFDQEFTLPENGFINESPATFMGWLDAEDDSYAESAYEWRFTNQEHVSLDKLQSFILEKGYENGAEIILYAIWDYAPELEVEDRYISIDFANSGQMTEEEILRTAIVSDREDGSIAPGVHDMNSLILVNYCKEDYLNWSGEGTISETYRATDRVGNVTEKMVRVHIVDTTAHKVSSEYQKARFISEKYIDLDLTEEEGGLAANSIWRTPEYYEVLSKTLSNERINQEEVDIRLTLFTATVTKPGSGEWLYAPEQVWKFSHEDVLAVKQYVKDHGPGNFYEEDALANFCVEFAHCRVK